MQDKLLFLKSNKISPAQNFEDLSSKSSLKYSLWFLLHLKHLSINNLSVTFMSARQDQYSLHLLL